MGFIKAHGLTIAQNGYIQNNVVETFTNATEPIAPADAGRIWFNSTLKAFRVTELDGSNAVIIRTLATDEDLDAYVDKIAAQTSNNSGSKYVGYDGATGANAKFSLSADTVDDTLDAIVAEIDAFRNDFDKIAAQTSNNSGSKYVGYDGATGANAKFSLSADTVDDTLDAIVAEIDAFRNDFDNLGTGSLTDMQDEIDNIEGAIGSMIDSSGDYVAFTTSNYMNAATSVTGALTALDGSLSDVSDVADAALPKSNLIHCSKN